MGDENRPELIEHSNQFPRIWNTGGRTTINNAELVILARNVTEFNMAMPIERIGAKPWALTVVAYCRKCILSPSSGFKTFHADQSVGFPIPLKLHNLPNCKSLEC